MSRPETGPMQFEGDWTGIFIRGDNAFGIAMGLRQNHEGLREMEIKQLIDLLMSSNENDEMRKELTSEEGREDARNVQRLRRFEECEVVNGE